MCDLVECQLFSIHKWRMRSRDLGRLDPENYLATFYFYRHKVVLLLKEPNPNMVGADQVLTVVHP